MKSLADGLPPEIAAQVSAEWRANEAGYWAARETLLAEYAGQWVAYSAGAVIASGRRPIDVLHAGRGDGRLAFVTRVGPESEPLFKMRRPKQCLS